MQVKQKTQTDSKKSIGYFKGSLKYINPTVEQLKEIYKSDDVEEPVYAGEKNDKPWRIVSFWFEEELTKKMVEYKVFVSKDLSQNDKDGTQWSWYVNQWGEKQYVQDEKNLFSSFTRIEVKTDDGWKPAKDENGEEVKLEYHIAHKGETAIMSLLRRLINNDWKNKDTTISLFLNWDKVMAGDMSELSSMIGTDLMTEVVGNVEITAKDGENGIEYYPNCTESAWLGGWKIVDCNLLTQNKGWDRYNLKENGKGKEKDLYEFYQAVKRSKVITDLSYLHEFDPKNYQQAGDQTIQHADEVVDANYDTSE